MSENDRANMSADEIAADLERTREEMARTIDELAARVDPRTKVKEVTAQAKEGAQRAQQAGLGFVEDLKAKDTRAIAIASGAVLAIGLLITLAIRRR
ncbi:DUF3618 domain-containing protein [Serinibacter salmoneus]|uniref:Uncharacterized protein DUF3618 n=1 Tax=Serinibacter salmoneus TaxID=556530 RepID=A0A2A9CZ06_9MICO|nr:DUF3618 domain-containing protein [Serinibacter salmoneus]PFG18819.1 uncharacterized protein DUF3618 [Serinibacter salmoneus]